MRRLGFGFACAGAWLAWSAGTVFGAGSLTWDRSTVDCTAAAGATVASAPFRVRNSGDDAVTIAALKPSCGCTTVEAPTLPWRLEPGAVGTVTVHVDLAGKEGRLVKTVTVESSAGAQTLTVVIDVPPRPNGATASAVHATEGPMDTEAAAVVARADRQAVFHNGRCAACHAQGVSERAGNALFASLCAVCHESAHRAQRVPDLRMARGARGDGFWREWIAHGKDGSLMPAFAQANGGVLDEAQIAALAEYCATRFAEK